jgi:hypothetical protein
MFIDPLSSNSFKSLLISSFFGFSLSSFSYPSSFSHT